MAWYILLAMFSLLLSLPVVDSSRWPLAVLSFLSTINTFPSTIPLNQPYPHFIHLVLKSTLYLASCALGMKYALTIFSPLCGGCHEIRSIAAFLHLIPFLSELTLSHSDLLFSSFLLCTGQDTVFWYIGAKLLFFPSSRKFSYPFLSPEGLAGDGHFCLMDPFLVRLYRWL